MLNVILTYAALIANLVIFVRLFTYTRDGAQFRPGISIVSALCMGCAGATVIYILQGKVLFTVQMWPVLLALGVIAKSLCAHRGNTAKMIESLMYREDDSWPFK